MKLTTRVINAFTAFSGNPKTKNSLSDDPNNFLRFGGRNKALYGDWSQVQMSDEDMYTGYSYAAIKKRANRASALGKRFLYTEGTPSIMDAAKKKGEELEHPYLELIRKSKDFTTRKFWHDISTYLDLEGVYYLMAVRAVAAQDDGNVKVGEVQSFKMLNPYNVRRVIRESDGTIGGYVESKNGMYREIPKEMVIEIRLLNPFNEDEAFSMTDAAKESQFTMKQAGDYTRHSIKGNINAPGAITTDVVLDDNIFDNFVSRIKNHGKGEPLYGNGAGSIHWENMQIDLDKAALDKINEIHRSILFAVSGTSKTAMGIEESGTGREVSKTQRDDFTENAVMPQIEDIIDALNLDYRRYYSEWERNEYEICLDNPLESDREAELKDIEIRESELNLRESLVQKGYEYEVAAKYAHGDITLEELGEPTLEPEMTPLEADRIAAAELGMEVPEDPNQTMPGTNPTAKDKKDQEKDAAARRNYVEATNKFVPIGTNDKVLAAARKKMAAKKKEQDASAKEAEKEEASDSEEQSEAIQAQEDKEKKAEKKETVVTVKLRNEVPTKEANQLSMRELPEDFFDDMEIDPRAVKDNDYRGCIMINTELIPITQFVKDGEKDLVEAERPEDHTMGAVAEVEPHATLLFGLLNNGNVWKEKVDKVLEGWSMDTVKINEVSYFDLGDHYCVIGLLEQTPEIIDGHERLTLLPHVNTFSEYVPHISLAYVKKDADINKWVKSLGKKYNGQVVATKGINYGDQPVESTDDDEESYNHVEDEHDVENLNKIKKEGDQFCVYSKDGKKMGCYDTSEEAQKRLGQIEYFKGKKKDSSPEVEENAIETVVEAAHSHDCDEHGFMPNETMEKAKNALDPEVRDAVILAEGNLQNAVAQLEGEIRSVVLQSLQEGKTEPLVPPEEEDGFVAQLAAMLAAYYLVMLPIYAAQLFSLRLAQYSLQGIFSTTPEIQKMINEAARKAALSHIATVIKDFTRAYEESKNKVIRDELIRAVQQKVTEQDPNYLSKLPDNPNQEDVVKAVDAGKFNDDAIYEFARDQVNKGAGLAEVQRAIQNKFSDISKTRAKTIAKHEASRVFNLSQYEADKQFLVESGNMDRAYKRLRSRTGEPCAVCKLLIEETHANPIPFTKNFADLGDELTASYRKDNGKMAILKIPINYESIKAGNVHVNCNCEYELVIKNDDGTFFNDLRLSGEYNKFNPRQARDKDGKWTDTPGSAAGFGSQKFSMLTADEFKREIKAEYKGQAEWTDEENEAVKSYTSSKYKDINKFLRTGEGDMQSTVHALDSAMKNELKEDTDLFRGIATEQEFKPGLVFQTRGYNSASFKYDTAEDFAKDGTYKDKGVKVPIVMRIKAKKGQKGVIPIINNDDRPLRSAEAEFILPRGLEFRVTAVEDKGNFEEVEVEIVNG